MAGRYAVDTDVSASRSRDEIESTLVRYGASAFAYGWTGTHAQLSFEIGGRRVRFVLPMPDRNERRFTHTPERKLPRNAAQQQAAYDQAVRQRWRALALVVKAKLEAVEAGITGFDEEFLANIVVGEQTVGEVLIPQLQAAIAEREMPALLPGMGS